jgi:hypothetical protein
MTYFKSHKTIFKRVDLFMYYITTKDLSVLEFEQFVYLGTIKLYLALFTESITTVSFNFSNVSIDTMTYRGVVKEEEFALMLF